MDQRPPPCAHRAPSLPVPPTTTPTASTPLYTAAWPHHPDAAYRPLMPSTVGTTTSDHGRASGAGYSPYLLPPTFLHMGITSPGHVARWWAREGHDAGSPHWANMGYYPYPFTPPMSCNPDNKIQDDRFPLSQLGEMQMPATVLRQMPAPAERQGPVPRESQVPVYGESQVLLSGESQVPLSGES
jgi:hypothetical protein